MYTVSYEVHLAAQVPLEVHVTQNGILIAQSILRVPSGAANYIHNFLATFAAGDSIELAVEGINTTTTVNLQEGIGLILNIVQIA